MLHLVAANLAFSLGKLLGRRNGDHGIHRSGSGLEPILNVRRNSEFCVRKNTGAETGRPCKLRSGNFASRYLNAPTTRAKLKANA
jgi:hypothetical protein